VLDDFIAIERHAAPGAVVLLHDTLPLNALTAARERRTGFYTGDGWKIVPCLRSLRPDLHVITLPTAPTGLTVITRLDPGNRVLSDRLPLIRQSYAALFSLGINDTDWVAQWLQSARGR
jgi:hypothetical protein